VPNSFTLECSLAGCGARDGPIGDVQAQHLGLRELQEIGGSLCQAMHRWGEYMKYIAGPALPPVDEYLSSLCIEPGMSCEGGEPIGSDDEPCEGNDSMEVLQRRWEQMFTFKSARPPSSLAARSKRPSKHRKRPKRIARETLVPNLCKLAGPRMASPLPSPPASPPKLHRDRRMGMSEGLSSQVDSEPAGPSSTTLAVLPKKQGRRPPPLYDLKAAHSRPQTASGHASPLRRQGGLDARNTIKPSVSTVNLAYLCIERSTPLRTKHFHPPLHSASSRSRASGVMESPGTLAAKQHPSGAWTVRDKRPSAQSQYHSTQQKPSIFRRRASESSLAGVMHAMANLKHERVPKKKKKTGKSKDNNSKPMMKRKPKESNSTDD